MDENKKIELIRLMARFKLQVRRQLDQSIDLFQLEHDLSYAKQRFCEIENQADDEELLVTLLTLRDLLLPPPEKIAPAVCDASLPMLQNKYIFGARS